MGIKMDYSQAAEGNGDIQDGVYECVINRFGFDNYKDREFIKFDLIVRNDVPQKYQNKHIFDNQYPKKDTGEYAMGYLFMIGKNAGIPDHKEWNDLASMLRDFAGHAVKVTVKNEEYSGKTYPHIKKWEPTAFPQIQHRWKDSKDASSSNSNPSFGTSAQASQANTADPFANSGQPIDVSDDDLPF
ncbi:DUF669 domain-containing protein [Lacticaseibacillus paracasei]|uniref:DUF669 domain-containing protein n=1 Tax=Lacticaseibacillus paracasei TaxID=1597 RepID=UPI003B99F957